MRHYLQSEAGASAAEFALVLPILLLFIFGLIEMGMLLFTSTQLHWASQDAARCASARIDCKVAGVANAPLVASWAASHYKGLAPASFTYTSDGTCSLTGASNAASGNKVVSNATFKFNAGVFYKNVNMFATACFP